MTASQMKENSTTAYTGIAHVPETVSATGQGVKLSEKGIAYRSSRDLLNSEFVKQTIKKVAQISTENPSSQNK